MYPPYKIEEKIFEDLWYSVNAIFGVSYTLRKMNTQHKNLYYYMDENETNYKIVYIYRNNVFETIFNKNMYSFIGNYSSCQLGQITMCDVFKNLIILFGNNCVILQYKNQKNPKFNFKIILNILNIENISTEMYEFNRKIKEQYESTILSIQRINQSTFKKYF